MIGATKLIKFLGATIKCRWPFSIHQFFGSIYVLTKPTRAVYDGKKIDFNAKIKNIWLALERLNFDWLDFEKL